MHSQDRQQNHRGTEFKTKSERKEKKKRKTGNRKHKKQKKLITVP
jgi:hypothetical protein